MKYLNASEGVSHIYSVLMGLIVFASLIYCIYKIHKIHNFKKVIISDVFWLIIPWIFCLFLYFCIGITYQIKLDLIAFLYIILFWGCYFLGKWFINYVEKKKNKNTLKAKKVNEDSLNFILGKKIDFSKLFILSLLSVVAYVIVIYINNPNATIGVTRNISRNSLSTLFHILSSSSLIIWLYELLFFLVKKEKMRYYAIPCAVLYNIPGIVISGRDALMIFLISTMIVVAYSICSMRSSKRDWKKYSKKIKKIAVVAIVLVFAYLLLISATRYGKSSEATLNLFKITTGVKFPNYLLFLYNKTGIIGKLLLNVIFYYSSQFSKYALIFHEYKGPYQYGLHQLHYVARLLPGYDSNSIWISMEAICSSHNLPGLRGFWDTMIGYSIVDFGRIGALLYSFGIGCLVEKVILMCRRKLNAFSLLIIVMICVGMFTSVEISPIYDYFYVFPLAWLILIYIYLNRKKKL